MLQWLETGWMDCSFSHSAPTFNFFCSTMSHTALANTNLVETFMEKMFSGFPSDDFLLLKLKCTVIYRVSWKLPITASYYGCKLALLAELECLCLLHYQGNSGLPEDWGPWPEWKPLAFSCFAK